MANVGVQDLIKGSKKDIEMVRSDAVEKVEVINPSGSIWIPIPHDVLPSSGNGYEGQLEGRPLNATEIKSLSTMNQKNSEALVDSVLKVAIRGVSFESLKIADKMFLLMWLRQNTYKRTGYTMNYECPDCEAKFQSSFDVDMLEVIQLDDYSEEKFHVEINGKDFKIKHRTIADEIIVKEFLKKNASSPINWDVEMLETASSIESIDDEPISLLAKYRIITDEDKFTPDDFNDLLATINSVGIGIKPIIEVTCVKCGGKGQSLIPFRPDFFLPASKSK